MNAPPDNKKRRTLAPGVCSLPHFENRFKYHDEQYLIHHLYVFIVRRFYKNVQKKPGFISPENMSF